VLEITEYNKLKESFINSQRLFVKLSGVSDNIANLDYDESGLYQEDEEMFQCHWKKLSAKITEALGDSLEEFEIKLLQNDNLEKKELVFNLFKDGIKSEICVGFNDVNSLDITQIS
jgi:hypothetical protein